MDCPKCSSPIVGRPLTCPSCHTRLEWTGDQDPLLGTVLDGRYELLERVGSGGMGTVYRANQIAMDREVAVKVVNALALQDPATVKRFETEARIISQLSHPNTLRLIDFGKLGDERPYLVTEFLRGHPLSAVLAEGPLPPRRTLEIIYEICDALGEAHKLGVIHRDLKPENIFLEEAGGTTVVRVLDFGIAKFGQTNNTATGTVCGTPAYMSPEQAQGMAADARSDLYALGILAYRCMVGRAPFEGEQPLAILLKQIQEMPVPLRQAMGRPDVATEVEWLVMTMLSKDADQRPATAPEVQEHIDYILDNIDIHGGSGATPVPEIYGDGPATITPTPALPVPAHFASDPLEGPDKPSIIRLTGVGLLGLAFSIVAGAVFYLQDAEEAPVAEPAKTELSAEANLPPVADVPPLEEAPDEIVGGAADKPAAAAKKTAKKSKKRKKAGKKKTSDKSVKKSGGDKPADPPPGFLDFDVN